MAAQDSTPSSIAALGRAEALAISRARRRQRAGRPLRRLTKACCIEVKRMLRLRVGVGGEHVEAQHHIGLGQLRRGLEAVAVERDRLHQLRRREVRGEGEGQAERRGELGAEQAGAEDPDRHVARRRRARRGRSWPAALVREGPSARARRAGTRRRRASGCGAAPARWLVGARRAAEARGRCGRGSSDASVPNCSAITSGAVVGQHDAAGAHADRARCRRRRGRSARRWRRWRCPGMLWCSASQ